MARLPDWVNSQELPPLPDPFDEPDGRVLKLDITDQSQMDIYLLKGPEAIVRFENLDFEMLPDGKSYKMKISDFLEAMGRDLIDKGRMEEHKGNEERTNNLCAAMERILALREGAVAARLVILDPTGYSCFSCMDGVKVSPY